MARNTLGDLNNHLFEQIERLNIDELSGDKLEDEMKKSQAMAMIAKSIISNANLALRATVAVNEQISNDTKLPTMLEG